MAIRQNRQVACELAVERIRICCLSALQRNIYAFRGRMCAIQCRKGGKTGCSQVSGLLQPRRVIARNGGAIRPAMNYNSGVIAGKVNNG
jgi:hypothetical protein